MRGMITSYWVSMLIRVVVELGIADRLARRALTAAQLARQARVHPDRLQRVLRALASLGVFTERRDGRFALTPLAATLRRDVPGSLHAFALMSTDRWQWDTWADLMHGVRTGRPVFAHALGMTPFDYLDGHPHARRRFNAAMISMSGAEDDAIVAAFDFGRFRSVVDVGGGYGSLLARLLRRHRHLQGVLFDRPTVIREAQRQPHFRAAMLQRRVTFARGDFHRSVPAGADAYVIRNVLHDWDDADCIALLKKCRAAMERGATLLVVEPVIERGNAPAWGKLLDIQMMLIQGRERTRAQFKALFAASGFVLIRVHPTSGSLAVVEARAR